MWRTQKDISDAKKYPLYFNWLPFVGHKFYSTISVIELAHLDGFGVRRDTAIKRKPTHAAQRTLNHQQIERI